MHVPPPPPPSRACPAPKTPEWGRWHMEFSLTPKDRASVEALVAIGLGEHDGKGFPSVHRARMPYCTAVYDNGWPGWLARLVWEILESIVGSAAIEDDIPF